MKVLSSMATRHLLVELAAAAEVAGLADVMVESTGGVTAAERVAAGETVDVVVLASGAVAALARDGHVDDGSRVRIVVSQVALAVPAPGSGAALFEGAAAFPSGDGVRDALLEAGRIGYSTGPSGTALIEQIEAWDLGDELRDRLVQARPGVPVAELLARGEVELGFQQLSELVGQPGIRILGVLPTDIAIDTEFVGAVATASADPVGARALLDFLTSDAVAEIKERHSFAP